MVVLVTVLMVCLCLALCLRASGVTYVGWTRGGLTTVHEDIRATGQRIRVLDVAWTYQSATYLDARWTQPVFRYHRLFDHAFDAWPDGSGPTSIAVLGGGGYAIPKHLVAHHPETTRIDVVEIDPAIERIARKHFFLDRLEQRYHAEEQGRLRLHIADASDWLRKTNETFDVIINDCFIALEPDSELMTVGAAELLHERLTPGGLYLANVVSALEGTGSFALYGTMGALGQAFDHLWVYPCSPNDPTIVDNNVVIATDADHVFANAWEWPC